MKSSPPSDDPPKMNLVPSISILRKYLLGLVRQLVNSSVPRTNQNKVTSSACAAHQNLDYSRLFCCGSLSVQVESLIIPVGRGHGLSIWFNVSSSISVTSSRQYSVPPRGAIPRSASRAPGKTTQLGDSYQPAEWVWAGSMTPRPELRIQT
jgi:hypothetical protein